jgi:dynein heavy chain
VWVISRNYNTDERMVPLMERIATEIASKVSSVVQSKTIFRQPPREAMKKIAEAKLVLEKWHDTYQKVRNKIEESGLGNRWEFDVKKLFDHTNYMAERCKDLYTAAQALEHFHNILGNELKAVTGDAEGINAVMEEVKNSVNHLESVAFDVFDKRFNTSWDALMSQFNAAIVEIEDNTKVSPALPASPARNPSCYARTGVEMMDGCRYRTVRCSSTRRSRSCARPRAPSTCS